MDPTIKAWVALAIIISVMVATVIALPPISFDNGYDPGENTTLIREEGGTAHYITHLKGYSNIEDALGYVIDHKGEVKWIDQQIYVYWTSEASA